MSNAYNLTLDEMNNNTNDFEQNSTLSADNPITDVQALNLCDSLLKVDRINDALNQLETVTADNLNKIGLMLSDKDYFLGFLTGWLIGEMSGESNSNQGPDNGGGGGSCCGCCCAFGSWYLMDNLGCFGHDPCVDLGICCAGASCSCFIGETIHDAWKYR